MKKISLSVLAILLAGSTLFANGHETKKAKQACHNCAKGKCADQSQCKDKKAKCADKDKCTKDC